LQDNFFQHLQTLPLCYFFGFDFIKYMQMQKQCTTGCNCFSAFFQPNPAYKNAIPSIKTKSLLQPWVVILIYKAKKKSIPVFIPVVVHQSPMLVVS
jgi:hypothetical protein